MRNSAGNFVFLLLFALLCGGSASSANEQAKNKVRFYNEAGSPFSGSVWGANNLDINVGDLIDRYPSPYIDIKVFSDSKITEDYEGAYDAQTTDGRFWKVTGPEGSSLPESQMVNLDKFDKKPTLQFFGDWAEAYKDVLSGDISLGGDIYESDKVFSWSVPSYSYDNVQIICDGNVDCGDWQSGNPDGVTVEIAPREGGVGTFSIYVANNPNSIEGIDQGTCFEKDGSGVKVPESTTCSTDGEARSGNFTSLRVETEGGLNLGGNLILEQDLTEIEVKTAAQINGENAGLVKKGSQRTLIKGDGEFSYQGPTTIQEGVLKLGVADAIPAESKVLIEKDATLDLGGHSINVSGLELNDGRLVSPDSGGSLTVNTSDFNLNSTDDEAYSNIGEGVSLNLNVNEEKSYSGNFDGEGAIRIAGGKVSFLNKRAPGQNGQFIVGENSILGFGSNESPNATPGNWDVHLAGPESGLIFNEVTAGQIEKSTETRIQGNITGEGYLHAFYNDITGQGNFYSRNIILDGENTYSGDTILDVYTSRGNTNLGLTVNGTLSDSTNVILDGYTSYNVNKTDRVGSLSSKSSDSIWSRVRVAEGQILSADGLGVNRPLAASIEGEGGFTKAGDGTLVMAPSNDAVNTYKGPTLIESGDLVLSKKATLQDSSTVIVSDGASLLLDGNGLNGKNRIKELLVEEGAKISFSDNSNGIMYVTERAFDNAGTIELSTLEQNNTNDVNNVNSGTIKLTGSLAVDGSFDNSGTIKLTGSLAVNESFDNSGLIHADYFDQARRINGDNKGNRDAVIVNSGEINLPGNLSGNLSGSFWMIGNRLDNSGDIIAADSIKLKNRGTTLVNREGGKINVRQIRVTSDPVGSGQVVIDNSGLLSVSEGIIEIENASLVNRSGSIDLDGTSTYKGPTNLLGGVLTVKGNLPDQTPVSVAEGAIYNVGKTDEIGSIEGAGSIVLSEGVTLTAGGLDGNRLFSGVMSGTGGFTKTGDSTLTLSGVSTYEGPTNLLGGVLTVTGNLSNITPVSVAEGAIYNVDNTDEIGSIEGAGSIELADNVILTAGGLDGDRLFSGVMSGAGGFTKTGDSKLKLSGGNTYVGATTIENGVLSLAHAQGIPRASETFVKGDGRLDLFSNVIDGSEFKINELSITDGGQVLVRADQPLVSKNILLKANAYQDKNAYPGGISALLKSKQEAPIRVSESFGYESGSLVVGIASTPKDPEGKWRIIDGKVDNIDKLATNTFLSVGSFDEAYAFEGLGKKFPVMGPALYKGYLAKGSLGLVIEAKSSQELECSLNPERPGCLGQKPIVIAPPITLPCEGNDCSLPGNELPGPEVGNELPGPEVGNELPGPEVGNELPGPEVGNELPGPEVGNELPDVDGDGLPDVIDPKPNKPCKGDDCLVGNELPDVDGDGLPDVIDPKPNKPCKGDDCLVGNELPDVDEDGLPDLIDPDDDNDGIADKDEPDTDGDGVIDDLDPDDDNDGILDQDEPDTDGDGVVDDLDPDDDNDGIPDEKDPDADGDGELDQLPGCEVGDNLCDVISDIPGDEDEAWEEEEEAAGEIIDALLDGLQDEEIDLPLSFDYGQLARLVGSGLAPRNVDAAGRGLALHNNLLVDAVFDRQPLRQFEELVSEEAVDEQAVVEEEPVTGEAAPVQPLWLRGAELSNGEAAEYVEAAVAQVDVEADVEAAAVEVSLVDLQDDELDLAKRDGVRAWLKGFGGNSRADDSSILYNDYNLSAYGTSFGVDVALSESFQIGAYANYGDLNVYQHSGDTGGGSWNPEGWGGGLTAQYSTRHFYVQGLLGASEFSGEQSRNILQINNDLGGNTARGDKRVTSYLGALRMGAPFKTGGVVLEPQGQVVWTRNHEQGFSETRGTEKNLRLKYKSRTTNFAETELGMKLSVPIRTGKRGLLVPSVRAAWLADWNQANEGQEIGYKFTKKTANFDSQLGTENGALIEAGLDYTVQNFNGISVKLYGRGGMEFWASDRGTTWRASGGVTFQF